MKRFITCLLILALVLSLCACGRSEPEEIAQMGNPVQEVGSPEEMREKLSISIDAPVGAENVRYSVISGTIGQVQYALNGMECCFRVSAQKEDISGVYGPFREDTTKLVIEHNVQRCETEARYTTEGGAVANWTIADLQYSLYATEASDWDLFGEMVKERMLDQLDSMEQAEIEKWTGLEGHVKVVSSGEICAPFVTVAYGADGDISYECPLVEPEEAKQAGALPCVPYGVDFEVGFTDGGKLSHVIVYDGEYNRLADRWNLDFSDLPSGTYFVNIIMSESSSGGDYTGYQCVFELVIP